MDDADRDALHGRGLDAIFDPQLRASIGRLIDDVKQRGDVAVCNALARFDGVTITPQQLRVTADEIDAAAVAPAVDEAIDDAIAHIRAFSEHQLARLTDWSFEAEPGLVVGEKLTPLASVGLFVPSGKASYPSVAYQLATPAVAAGVAQIVLVVPPIPGRADGAVDPAVLVVCRKLGIREVFRVNGPAGIAALGFGTETIPRVRMVVGPGSPAVTLAQIEMQRYGVTTLMLLGPTESVVIADSKADPVRLAADLLIEAEHGTDSTVVLLTPDEHFGSSVDAELARQINDLPETVPPRPAWRWARTAVASSPPTSTRPWRSPTASPRNTSKLQSTTRSRARSSTRCRQRRRDPRRTAHALQRRQLCHRLPSVAAHLRLRSSRIAAIFVATGGARLRAPEVGQHGRVIPACGALGLPAFVILRIAADIDQAIDRGRSAEHLAARRVQAAAAEAGLRLGVVAPVVLSIPIGMESAEGICTKIERSEPPYSRSSTEFLPSSVRRSASTQPAEPAPTMT